MLSGCAYQILTPDKEGEEFFTSAEKKTLYTIPKHVAIIPDGNRRWAEEHNESVATGYIHGALRLIETALAAKEIGIHTLTFFSFSTENWKRPQNEIEIFLQLMELHLLHYASSLAEKDIRLHVIGDTQKLPQKLQETIYSVTQKTEKNSALHLVLAMNYGGRDELVRAFSKILNLYKEGFLLSVDEKTISSHLDTAPFPDPDLIIRTSGEQRVSNFLLWQGSYAEMYNEPAYWPDFSPTHFLSAMQTFQQRVRRRGGG